MGYNLMVIWECQTKNISDLETELLDFIAPVKIMDHS